MLAGVHTGEYRNFNPDFLLLEPRALLGGSGHIYVVETKGNEEADPVTTWKIAAAEAYVAHLNELLDANGHDDRPRYSFHLLAPNDYPTFKAWLAQGQAHEFVGGVHGRLRPSNDSDSAGQ
jgi:hypothetical protein